MRSNTNQFLSEHQASTNEDSSTNRLGKDSEQREIFGMNEELKNKRGHMAVTNNVRAIKKELGKQLTYLEYLLVDIILDCTIGWGYEVAAIPIQHFVDYTGKESTHVYAALRKLKEKEIIICQKTKSGSIYGLNHIFFGKLLIQSRQTALQMRKKKLKVIVDNSKGTDNNGHRDRRLLSQAQTIDVSPSDNRCQSPKTQTPEKIEQSIDLKKVFKEREIKERFKEDFGDKKRGESFTFFKNPKPKTLSQEEKALQIKWLQETDGNEPFDLWFKQTFSIAN